MIQFSMVESVSGRAKVVTREMFEEVMDRAQVVELCRRIAEEGSLASGCEDKVVRDSMMKKVGEMKRSLPAFCWHTKEFKDGKRNNYSATASGLTMIDVDHVSEPEALFSRVREKAISLGLVAAHVTPSCSGLRLVFVTPEGMTIEEAQRWLAGELSLEGVDECVKDLARLSFVVPRGYWLYVDYDVLFGEKVVQVKGSGVEVRGSGLEVRGSGLEVKGSGVEVKGSEVTYEKEYKGVAYERIVECLETLYGGKPVHGNRNTQIFSMACMLRYICNDDPQWIAKILPTYGESEGKWMSSIRSACTRNQSQTMPQVLIQAIEMAKAASGQSVATAEESSPLFDENRPPKLPARLPKLIRHLIKNVPEVCRESVATGVFPALATHLSGVRFKLIDGTSKEANFMCCTMARQSSGKASINKPVEYIMADIKERDDISRRREQEWKDAMNTKGSNKEKPKRPDDLCVQMLVTDMTNAAFVQRLKDAGEKYLYTHLEELDMLKQLQTNGMKDIGKIICLCFDNGIYGQERVGNQSVTALLPLRWNWNASSTVEKGMEFFKNRLLDGTLSRVNFTTIIKDDTKEFVYGEYDEQYAVELKPYITNLNLCKGEVTCSQALAMARKMQKRCTEIGLQSEDIIYQEFSYRAVTIAYMKAMVLYIANDMTWDKSIEDFCEWSLEHDLWTKNYFFGEAIREARSMTIRKKRPGRVNMLNMLPDIFTVADAQNLRKRLGKDVEDTAHMLSVWVYRQYIVYDEEREVYEKTAKYKM